MTLTYQLNEIKSVAKTLITHFKHHIILFDAAMGSGKTTLIKALIHQLGEDQFTGSPTFSIVNEYNGKENKIYHFDLYRIETEEELYDIGFEDYLNTTAFCFIEWPKIGASFLDQHTHTITIEVVDSLTRQLTLT